LTDIGILSLKHFWHQVIAIAPDYALAYAGIADY